MNLNELLNENPGARAEHNALVAAEYQKGVDVTEASVKARVDKATPILESEDYPGPIKSLACKVITGEEPASALTAAVTSYDVTKEAEKAKAAADDTEDAPDTPAEGADAQSEDGVIRSQADLNAEDKRLGVVKKEVN